MLGACDVLDLEIFNWTQCVFFAVRRLFHSQYKTYRFSLNRYIVHIILFSCIPTLFFLSWTSDPEINVRVIFYAGRCTTWFRNEKIDSPHKKKTLEKYWPLSSILCNNEKKYGIPTYRRQANSRRLFLGLKLLFQIILIADICIFISMCVDFCSLAFDFCAKNFKKKKNEFINDGNVKSGRIWLFIKNNYTIFRPPIKTF